MKMTNLRMNVLAMAIIGLGVTPVWAQTISAAETMDHAQHQGAQSPDAGKPPAAQDAMPAMDHSGMKPEKTQTAGEMPGMDHGSPSAPQQGTAAMDHGEMNMQGGSAPPDARDPHAYSGGYTLGSGKYALPGPRQLRLADEHNFGSLLVDRLERVDTRDGNATAYEAQAWFGRNYDRLVVKAEGDYGQGKLQEARTELLWGHAIATFWDTQLGVRYDSGVGPDRSWLAFGVQGLAPYWFEVDAAAYVGDKGRTAFRLGAEYELLLTQKLVLQPRLEINAYGKSDEALGIGSGLSDGVAGLRLRYEFTRQFAPYVGVERAGKFGKTADLARAAGEKTDETRWVAGVRFWF
jgi:copper resistance protein B